MEWSKFSCNASGSSYSLTLRYKRRLLETDVCHFYKHSFRFAQGTKRNENRCAFGVYYCILPL